MSVQTKHIWVLRDQITGKFYNKYMELDVFEAAKIFNTRTSGKRARTENANWFRRREDYIEEYLINGEQLDEDLQERATFLAQRAGLEKYGIQLIQYEIEHHTGTVVP